ncbi:MAG TPA: DUF2207 domain-containing protein [Levilinea sp.]|nr:DUF2207 domain-containing protein [Levilinea sp.]
MLRKWMPCWLAFFILTFSFAPVQAGKEYFARTYVTDVIVQANGSLLVSETVTFEFSGGPFTYVYREIPTDYTDGISEIRAVMDGRVLSQGSAPGQYDIQSGNPLRVTWHFQETYDQVHTFTLQYRVAGAIRQQPDMDLLEWNLLPTEYEYRIQSVAATVTYPDKIALLQPPGILRGQAEFESRPGVVAWKSADIEPNQPLHVSMQFPPGSMITAPPTWQSRAAETASAIRSALPFALFSGFAAALLVVLLFAAWQKRAGQTDLHLSPVSQMPKQMSPPASLPPAYTGLLARNSDQVAWQDALSTLIDLSRRGWVQLVETHTGLFKTRSFRVQLLREPGNAPGLRQHELSLLEMLFTNRSQPTREIDAQELTKAVSNHFKTYSNALKKEMEAEGWFNARRRGARTWMNAAGVTLLLLGIVVVVVALIFGNLARGAGSIMGLQISLFTGAIFAGFAIAGVAGLIMAANLSLLADPVLQQAAQWKSFSQYLKDVTRNREPVIRPDLFEVYLPYAASFGLVEAWAKYFQKQGMQQAPAWFTAESLDDNMASFIAVISSTNSAGDAGTGGDGGSGGAGGGGGSGAG